MTLRTNADGTVTYPSRGKHKQHYGSLVGPYAIDRIDFPTFYVPISEDNVHKYAVTTVLTATDVHDQDDWLCLGVVSRQTPLGQGYFCGFPKQEVRVAEVGEVHLALLRDHCSHMGADFRPGCKELQNASFHLIMSSAIANWTNDEGREPPVHNVSRDEITDFAERTKEHYNDLMQNWNAITDAQINHILLCLYATDTSPQQ